MNDVDSIYDGQVSPWEETFAIIKAKKPHPKAFATIIDKNEITIILDQAKVNHDDVIEMELD